MDKLKSMLVLVRVFLQFQENWTLIIEFIFISRNNTSLFDND